MRTAILTLSRVTSALTHCLIFVLALTLTGCASLPANPDRPASFSRAATGDSPLTRVVKDANLGAGQSGVWPMPVSAFALDARLALIREARDTLDLQYYHVANDEVGRAIVLGLRDAARRGVRVRLLVDDMYTAGLDPLLTELESTPNAQVRLFNPFTWGRDDQLMRYAALLGDFVRLNQRMHNKLFIADGTLAVVGGRNLADEYFFRSAEGNFLDMDFVVMGDIAPQLGRLFDAYWNSDVVYPAGSIIRGTGASKDSEAPREKHPFDPAARDILGQPSMTAVLAGQARAPVYPAQAYVHADSPVKGASGASETVTARFVQMLRSAKQEALLINPYFIPGRHGMATVGELRKRGVALSVVTNSLGTSDEPLVNIAYLRYREKLLDEGVRIFELSDEGLKRDNRLRGAFGNSRGQLHAKLAFIDREAVMAGSMNMDERSAFTNTEIGMLVRSPALAERLLSLWQFDRAPGVHEVRRKREGHGIEWVRRGLGAEGRGEEVSDVDPDGGWFSKLKLMIQLVFVPEQML